MKTISVLLFLVALGFLGTSSQNPHDLCFESFLKVEENFDFKLDTTAIITDEFRFEVFSKYVFNKNQERPIYLSQNVVLKRKDLVLYANEYHGKLDTIEIDNLPMIFLRDFITDIGIMQSDQTTYFIINGWGGCNDCSNYSAIINDSGVLQYELFQNEKLNQVYLNKGEVRAIFKSDEEYRRYCREQYDKSAAVCTNCAKSAIENSFADPFEH